MDSLTRFTRLSAHQRAQLAASERAVGQRLNGVYQEAVRQRLSPHITVFTDAYSRKLAEVRAASGEATATVPSQWLADHAGGDVANLQRFVQIHVGQFAGHARTAVAGGMQDAAQLGDAHAQQQLHAAVQPAAQLIAPEALIQQVVRSDAQFALLSRLAGGTSLSALFDSFAPDTADRVYRTLAAGLANGDGPRVVADLLYGILDNNLTRSLTIARTEMLRTYRRSQLDNYRANSDIVGQWQWLCDEGPRTCGACLAMDGTLHPLDEELDGHINCRCSAQPVTKSWSDILAPFGIDGSDLDAQDAANDNTRPSGADWFAQQDEATQIQILGKAKQAAYAAGDLSLPDLVAVDRDPVWGTSIREKSLREMGLDPRTYLPSRGASAGLGPRGRSAIRQVRAAAT